MGVNIDGRAARAGEFIFPGQHPATKPPCHAAFFPLEASLTSPANRIARENSPSSPPPLGEEPQGARFVFPGSDYRGHSHANVTAVIAA